MRCIERLGAILLIVSILASGSASGADEGVALTVYNGGYGVVREIRKVDVGDDGHVRFQDVATGIDATTVHFKSLTDPAAKLLEQNYQYDLVSADKLLRRYIDRPIEVIAPGTSYEGRLLSFDTQQLVLQDVDGITMVQRPHNVRDIRFGPLPEGLITRPTLLWMIATRRSGEHLAEVTYQTTGLNWHAEYVLVLGDDDTTADLRGWVSVENNSGKRYASARLKFVAGDVHRVAPRTNRHKRGVLYAAVAEGDESSMQEKAFFEYHLYTLPRRSTVADREVKQLEMFPPVAGLTVAKRFLYNPLGHFRHGGGRHLNREYGISSEKKVRVFIEFENAEKNGLGIPLPAGKIRVFKQDPEDGALEFVGEERIDHTPKDEELSLQIGNAFDIVGQRRQTDFRLEKHRNWMRESIEIKIRNHKEKAVDVRIKEPISRWSNWQITERSHDFAKLDAGTVAFDVSVPAEGTTATTYTVEYAW